MTIARDYATTSFGQIHYRHAGNDDLPALVLLHQTPSTSAMYERLMPLLAADYRLLAPDTPGMGMSDPLPGEASIEALAAGIDEFLDAVGIEQCLLFGHHTGAAIAAALAAANPARVIALALSGPTVLDETLRTRLPEAAKPFPADDEGAHLTQMWQRVRGKDENVSADIALRETIDGIALGERYAATYDAVMANDAAATLAAIRCPVLVFAGSNDVLYGRLNAALEQLENGEKREIAGAGTFVCETHADEVVALLREFFGRQLA